MRLLVHPYLLLVSVPLTCRTYGDCIGLLLRFLVGSFVLPEYVHGYDTALARQVIQTPQLVQVPIYAGLKSVNYL